MTEQKEQTIGPSVYEQLEEMVKKCAISGWITKNGLIFVYIKKVGDQEGLIFKNAIDGSCLTMDYHWLFSKDSGIMERVEWEVTNETMDYLYHHKIGEDYKYITHKGEVYYHYMIMGPMTAEEKVQYFIANAKLSTKSE